MSTPRNTLVAGLASLELLDEFKVVGYARKLTLERPTVMVRVDTVAPAGGARDYGFALIVAVPETDPTGAADDALDDALEDVLHALDVSGAALGVRFDTARRATLDEAYPAYEITVNVRSVKES